MHNLKLLQKPCKLHNVRYNMAKHSEFIITSVNNHSRCDLGQCVVGTRPPYFVARMHVFKTNVKNVSLAERNEQERCKWLTERMNAYATAEAAEKQGMTVREVAGDGYDEEHDEARVIAKVPGLNIYLELYGVMGDKDEAGEEYWEQRDAKRPFDRMIDAAAAMALNRMAYHVRATMKKQDQRDCATRSNEWQPREDWCEDYDGEEFFQKPEPRGVGFDFVNQDKHEPQFPRHQFNDAEKEEYQRLKQEAVDNGESLDKETLAKLAQKACANVAAAKMLDD